MTRHETIVAGRTPRLVRVERRRKRKVAACWSRKIVHQVGLAAVADELGVAALLPLGGIMTAERGRALLGRKRPISSERFTPEKPSGDDGLNPISMPKTGGGFAPSGLLADDVCRHIWAERGRFSPVLYDGSI